MPMADPISLGLVHTVLSDIESSSCLMFVGCYRENEVNEDHIVCGLMKMLSNFDVPIANIHLAGLSKCDINTMISDALSILPRFCQRLSNVICRKTDGNPFFAISFLSSMVDRGNVQYSLREKRWTYDIDSVLAEEVSNSVIDLILRKMTTLTKECQSALKVASCFGTQVDSSIIKALSSTSIYPQLNVSMAALVEKSFVDFDGSKFRFIHDKVREAAAELIEKKARDQYHFRIGVLLQNSFGTRLLADESELLFIVIGQLKHGLSTLVVSGSQQITIAKLNCRAGWKRIVSNR